MLRTFASLVGLIGLLVSAPSQAEFAVPSCESLDEWAADIPTVRGADRDHVFAVIERMKSAAVSAAVFGTPYEGMTNEELQQINSRLIECMRLVDRGVDPLMASRLSQTQTFVSIDAEKRRPQTPEEPISNSRQAR